MKKIFTLLTLCVLCAFAFAPRTRGQIIYNWLSLTNGTYYYPILQNLQPQSYPAYMPFAGHTLIISNIVTNINYVYNYGYVPTNQPLSQSAALITGVTNFSAALGFTNGGTAIIPISQAAFNANVQPTAWITLTNTVIFTNYFLFL